MTTHLSARLTWHDSAWNGHLCRSPSTNAACMEHEHVRDGRKLKVEESNSGCALDTLAAATGYLPPCQRDANAFGERRYTVRHHDPLAERGLPPVDEEVPPATICPTPYRWMLEANFRDICEAENLLLRGSPREQPGTWVQEDDRQRAMLERFWGKLDEGKSFVFFYCNRGNAVDDATNRLLVGVARIAEVGEQLYFGKSTRTPGRFPVWSRRVTHNFPGEGVRLPYQEYIARNLPVESIACRPPADLALPFSYVAEHLSDGHAVSALLALTSAFEKVRADQREGRGVKGDWDGALSWLSGALDEVWGGRGAFPGIGALLHHLQFARGVAYHATVLRAVEESGENSWAYLKAILEGRQSLKPQFAEGLLIAAAEWRKLAPSHTLLETLIRFELTSDQFTDIVVTGTRKDRGIEASVDNLIANPYLIYEQDHGTARSAAVSLEVIDQGMMPEGHAARFRTEPKMAPNDRRRIRATMCAVLRRAADAGDTVLPFEALVLRASNFHSEKRRCTVNADVAWSSEDRRFHEQILWMKAIPVPTSWEAVDKTPAEDDELAELREDKGADGGAGQSPDEIQLVALKRVRRCEIEIAQVIKSQAGEIPDIGDSPDWVAVLTAPVEQGGFGEPKTDRQQEAIQEKAAALEILFTHRLSILTGGAGTGKTSVLKTFLRKLNELQGPRSMILTAPTGKARVRLQGSTGRQANTIHQILNDAGMLGANFRVLDEPTKGKRFATTLVIDESSMPSVELLAALFRAVDAKSIERLIFVGDPFQLPPIGPGRPFIDIIRWLQGNHPSAVAELQTCMRVETVGDKESVSAGLQLANGYRDYAAPADDRIAAEAARAGTFGDVTFLTWNDHEELLARTQQALELIGVPVGDTKAFDRSLGISAEKWSESEAWQILSPTRIHAFGTSEINRVLQGQFRAAEIANAVVARSRWPAPMGDQGIVYRDKVLQTVNMPRWLPKDSAGLRFVANGEIGIVAETWKKRPQDREDRAVVFFSTQPTARYSFLKSEVKECLELAYAITVHKAQGSDFGDAIFVLPRKAQTLTRELLYTALTRFRRRLIVLLERDTEVLDALRSPAYSETARRSTFMFDLLLGETANELRVSERFRPDGLIHRAEDGTPMRSKSEVIVYEVLKRCGLSPRYEERLFAPGSKDDYRLPDFTVRHGGRTWYWEHLGMLSSKAYRDDWAEKEEWYRENGFHGQLLTSKDYPGERWGVVYADEIRSQAMYRILGKKV
ncbi:AAA family ATPase [Variovorax robiniae]|uniref:AAA family ATPase n=1 Tax=Variovorax robiniae TaxID=1836199 RepID=A0ABU8X8G0_9BURK